jgi:hypothetical protein
MSSDRTETLLIRNVSREHPLSLPQVNLQAIDAPCLPLTLFRPF